MVFLAAGMGGGISTGAIPVVTEVARQSGALTIAIVTVLFTFEGEHCMQVTEEGISQLVTKVDTLIIIVNDRLLKLSDKKIAVDGAFKFADEILWRAVQAIAEVITVPGLINLDFAGVRAITKDSFTSLTGRSRELYYIRRENTYPVKIESVLQSNPKIYDVGIIGVPDERLSEIAFTVIDPKPGEMPIEEEVARFCEQNLPGIRDADA